MMTFTEYLIEEKNVHMEHLEDLVLNRGLVGAREIFNFLTSLGVMLSGETKNKVSATVKWDGAPSIFMGIDPSDGKFFVAKKGIFNVKPKLYKSESDIDADLSGELNAKFKIAFSEFKKLGLKSGVYQGDLMFTSGDVKTQKINDITYYTFQPNTIVYAVSIDTALGKAINKAKIGVVWHTTYTGKTIQTMKASFGKGIVSKLKKASTIWMDDATYKDVSGQAAMTAAETKQYREIISKAGSLLRGIPKSALDTISSNADLLILVKTYNNLKVRSGEEITNTTEHAKGLVDYILTKFQKEEGSKKTEKGKAAVKERKNKVLAPITNASIPDIANIFEFMNIIVKAKNMIISKMNSASTVGAFLRTPNGFKATTPEGYVAIDRLTNGVVKLVDRLEFSKANFSADIAKGWQR